MFIVSSIQLAIRSEEKNESCAATGQTFSNLRILVLTYRPSRNEKNEGIGGMSMMRSIGKEK